MHIKISLDGSVASEIAGINRPQKLGMLYRTGEYAFSENEALTLAENIRNKAIAAAERKLVRIRNCEIGITK